MKKELKESIHKNKLRQKAEKLVSESTQNIEKLTPSEIKAMVHELEVHQIELELQNEELQRLYNELEISKKHYLDLYDNAPVGYMLYNSDYKIIQTNLTALELLKVTSKDIVNKKIQKFIYRDDQDIFYKFKRKFTKEGEKHNCELRMLKSDGNTFWAYIKVTLEKDNQGEVLFKVIVEDITKRKEIENELKRKNDMLISQSRFAAMGEMIGMIAHQWRQPLAGIGMDVNNMLIDIELDEFSEGNAKEYCNSITSQTQHLSKTIDDFRNFFKSDKEISKINIKDVLDETFSIVKDSLKNNNIELKTNFKSTIEVDVYPRELMQVFINIITNAKDSFVQSKIDKPVIDVKVYEDKKYLNIEICDNGSGIKEDIIDKIFEPYFTTKGEGSGTGLGLYMSKMIIEEHLKGIIEVHNRDVGVCFIIRLLKNGVLI